MNEPIKQTLANLLAKVTDYVKALSVPFASALTWFLFFSAAGFVLVAVGVYVIAGLGIGLVANGILCILVALFIRQGMING